MDITEQESRAGKTHELLFQTITINLPQQRCFVLPHRNDNIFAKIAETLWVLNGRNDVKFLSRYLPRAIDYSDDGKTWRAGYGTRMRGWFSYGKITDQLLNVINKLAKDRYTRQAVISLWDPVRDYVESKDIPCNNWLHFIIRKTYGGVDELHLNIAQRSSDILWGFSGINTFEFSVLHMLVANFLGCRVGTLNYNITSLHIYEKHWKRLHDIVTDFSGKTIYDYGVKPVEFAAKPLTSFANFDIILNAVIDENERMQYFNNAAVWHAADPFLCRCSDMLDLYDYWEWNEHKLDGKVIDMLSDMPDDDLKCAAIEYIGRTFTSVMEEVTMSDEIMTALTNCMPSLVTEL
jgi:thymidylate synthase